MTTAFGITYYSTCVYYPICIYIYGNVFLQIISFLQQNAHPRVAEKTPSVPENVSDQVCFLC